MDTTNRASKNKGTGKRVAASPSVVDHSAKVKGPKNPKPSSGTQSSRKTAAQAREKKESLKPSSSASGKTIGTPLVRPVKVGDLEIKTVEELQMIREHLAVEERYMSKPMPPNTESGSDDGNSIPEPLLPASSSNDPSGGAKGLEDKDHHPRGSSAPARTLRRRHSLGSATSPSSLPSWDSLPSSVEEEKRAKKKSRSGKGGQAGKNSRLVQGAMMEAMQSANGERDAYRAKAKELEEESLEKSLDSTTSTEAVAGDSPEPSSSSSESSATEAPFCISLMEAAKEDASLRQFTTVTTDPDYLKFSNGLLSKLPQTSKMKLYRGWKFLSSVVGDQPAGFLVSTVGQLAWDKMCSSLDSYMTENIQMMEATYMFSPLAQMIPGFPTVFQGMTSFIRIFSATSRAKWFLSLLPNITVRNQTMAKIVQIRSGLRTAAGTLLMSRMPSWLLEILIRIARFIRTMTWILKVMARLGTTMWLIKTIGMAAHRTINATPIAVVMTCTRQESIRADFKCQEHLGDARAIAAGKVDCERCGRMSIYQVVHKQYNALSASETVREITIMDELLMELVAADKARPGLSWDVFKDRLYRSVGSIPYIGVNRANFNSQVEDTFWLAEQIWRSRWDALQDLALALPAPRAPLE